MAAAGSPQAAEEPLAVPTKAVQDLAITVESPVKSAENEAAVAWSDVYDDVEIEDMEFDADGDRYLYPCPCGDQFVITVEQLQQGEDIATCPSCSLRLRVIFDVSAFLLQQSSSSSSDSSDSDSD